MGKREETQQTNEKQGTEFSAIYRNQIQVPKFDLVGRNINEKNKKPKKTQNPKQIKTRLKRGVKQQSVLSKNILCFCLYIANPKPSQSRISPPTHKKTKQNKKPHELLESSSITVSLSSKQASWTPHWNKKADLDEVLFLFFGVVLSSFCIDYSCVCVCCVIGSFGFMSEVCTFMSGKIAAQNDEQA